jgi:hypothetical protein
MGSDSGQLMMSQIDPQGVEPESSPIFSLLLLVFVCNIVVVSGVSVFRSSVAAINMPTDEFHVGFWLHWRFFNGNEEHLTGVGHFFLSGYHIYPWVDSIYLIFNFC